MKINLIPSVKILEERNGFLKTKSVAYKKENLLPNQISAHIILDGEIGSRFDRFVHERVSGKFAIDEILREAEERSPGNPMPPMPWE